jgi:uncharacterized protein YbjT (DUF2867 family)
MSRDRSKLDDDPWRSQVDVVEGDVLDPTTLGPALAGCDAAYYLIHSMDGGVDGFRERDRTAAINFRDAAAEAGIKRIVYLGGLGEGGDLSQHLASRQEVGAELATGPVPVTEIRAAVIIGSGSVSFEMMRYLTEVLPVMVTPRWVRTKCQPIAVRNVLEILVAALAESGDGNHIWPIGGPDQLTYEAMMRVYAEVAELPRRIIIPVPLLSPQLSRHWIGLVTPLPTGVAKPLVNSLRNEVTVADNSVAERLSKGLIPFREAVERAVRRSMNDEVTTRWSDSAVSAAEARPTDPGWAGGTVKTDEQRVPTTASPEDLFWAFSRIGGDVGYYTFTWLWKLRGVLDSVVGGVGLRRGRRHPEDLRQGEALDFWRVAAVEPGRRISLWAEMKLPGKAWLEFDAVSDTGETTLVQTAFFKPKGLFGRLYWAVLVPFHVLIFKRMARKIVEAAERRPSPGTSN